MPVSVPSVGESRTPAGSFPLATRHLSGLTPPLVRSAARYALPTAAAFRRAVVTASLAATFSALLTDVARPSESVAVRPNVNLPADVGVPAIVPFAGSSTRPLGSAPEDTDHVYVP